VVPGLVGEWTPAVAERRGCAFSSEGKVSCWEMALPPHPTIVWEVAIDDVVAIDVAPDHACARKKDGSLHCWGETRFGVLGDGDRRCALAPKRVALPAISGA